MTLALAFLMVSCSRDEGTNVEEGDEQQVKSSFSEPIPGQYIIVYNEEGKSQGNYLDNQKAVQTKTQQILAASNISSAEILNAYSAAISGATVKLSGGDLAKLKGNKAINCIEQDRIVALAPPCGSKNGDPCDGGGDDGSSSSQETPYGIARVNGVADYTGSGVAWIVDTGIDLDHEDLNVDGSRGFNAFTTGRDAGDPDDGNGHGSHVAGTVAALNNNVGVIGVAPGATVIPVKVLDSRGSGSYSGVIAGVDHVAANGSNGDVANLSLGGPVSQALDDAVLAASQNGIKFSLAAGNDSDDANSYSPARVNGANIVTISAMDSNDDWAYFSNYANPPVDYTAPGVLLLGNASTDGNVNGDPDGNADPIIVN